MLRGALEITGFLAQRASLEPLGLRGQRLQHLSPQAVFISVMSFAYYRQLLSVSYHFPEVPRLFFSLSSPVLWGPWATGTQEAAF